MQRRYIGFYWTLPVPWAGFVSLPRDVDSAAEQSRTIRYQRDLVRRWVRQDGGFLVQEVARMESAPDRTSEAFARELEPLLRTCRGDHAQIVIVNFEEESP